MDECKRPAREQELTHTGCKATVSIGPYGQWHFCEACEVTAKPHRIRRERKAGHPRVAE
jgi:hypothetical protein